MYTGRTFVIRAVRWAWDRDRQGVTFFFVCYILVLIPTIAPYPLESLDAPDWLLVLVGLAAFAGIVCVFALALLTASRGEQPQGNAVERAWWAFWRWHPVRIDDEMYFAEAMSQALFAGMTVPDAILAAAEVNPSSRFRDALRRAASFCRSGLTVEASMERTGVCLSEHLLVALRVGMERGLLANELGRFARACDIRAPARLARAVMRSDEASRFADALADLLRDHRLSPWLLIDAGDLAAAGNSAFRTAVSQAAIALENGASLGEALWEQWREFDPLFCRLVDVPDDRSQLIAVLKRLGDTPE